MLACLRVLVCVCVRFIFICVHLRLEVIAGADETLESEIEVKNALF